MINLHALVPTVDFWITAYGAKIPVIQMSDQHVRNVINRFAWRLNAGSTPLSAERRTMLEAVLRERERRRADPTHPFRT